MNVVKVIREQVDRASQCYSAVCSPSFPYKQVFQDWQQVFILFSVL